MSFVQDIKDRLNSRNRRRNRKRGLIKQPERGRKTRMAASPRQWVGKLLRRESSNSRSSSRPSARTSARRQRQFWSPLRNSSEAMRDAIGSTRWVSGMMLLMCVVILYKVNTNSRFFLDNISVTGTQFLPADVVIGASGLADEHIFRAEPGPAIEGIKRLPGVNDAEIMVQWPDTAAIHIEEDTPILMWEEAGEGYWVNASGEIVPIVDSEFDLLRVIAKVPPAPAPTPLPTVDPEAEADEAAEIVEAVVDRPNTYLTFVPDDIMLGALSLQTEISRTQGVQLETLVYEIHGGLSYADQGGWKAWAGPNGEVPIVTPGGWRVFFGTDRDMAAKVAMYNAIVANLLDRGITPEYVNVSSIDRPFYKPTFGSETIAASNEG